MVIYIPVMLKACTIFNLFFVPFIFFRVFFFSYKVETTPLSVLLHFSCVYLIIMESCFHHNLMADKIFQEKKGLHIKGK